jgi:predicted GIY-YIG superfamily endonuclease
MAASASADSFFVYIVRCADDGPYVGHTSGLQARFQPHNDGRGALWTANRRPVHEQHPSEVEAIARERQLKQWTHDKKLALINGELGTLKSLARRRIR